MVRRLDTVLAVLATLLLGLAPLGVGAGAGAGFGPTAAVTAAEPDLHSCDEAIGHDEACTHGIDELGPAEAGSSTLASGERNLSALAGTADALPGIPCYTSGPMVKVFYLYQSGTTNRLAQRLPHIREVVAVADHIFAASAAQTKGIRHIRWKMTSGCRLAVRAVAVNMSLSLGTIRYQLMQRGLLRSSEKGLAFRETGSSCHGRGELYRDDRYSTRYNRNNKGGMLSWVMLGTCLAWNAGHLRIGEMTAHEVAHTLGAVQWTSPNSSRHGHCVDTHDVMCYKDASTTRLKRVCALMRPLLLDCRKNDYFHTAPRSGTYLATHWNIARNAFLARTQPAAWDRLERPTAAIVSPTSGSTISGNATVEAAVTVPGGAGIDAVVFFVNGTQYDVDTTPPYTTAIDVVSNVPDGAQLRLAAAAIDTYDRVGWSDEITVTASNPPAQVAISSPSAGSTVSGTIPVAVTATPAPATAIQSVELLVNGTSVDEDSEAPWAFELDTLGLANGTATLVVRALDDHGRSFESPAVSITVANTPSSVSLTSPAQGAVVSGPFEIVAAPRAGTGSTIVSVAIMVDGSWIDVLSADPWSTAFDPADYGYEPGASIVLSATLEDSLGRFVEAPPVTVTYQP